MLPDGRYFFLTPSDTLPHLFVWPANGLSGVELFYLLWHRDSLHVAVRRALDDEYQYQQQNPPTNRAV